MQTSATAVLSRSYSRHSGGLIIIPCTPTSLIRCTRAAAAFLAGDQSRKHDIETRAGEGVSQLQGERFLLLPKPWRHLRFNQWGIGAEKTYGVSHRAHASDHMLEFISRGRRRR